MEEDKWLKGLVDDTKSNVMRAIGDAPEEEISTPRGGSIVNEN